MSVNKYEVQKMYDAAKDSTTLSVHEYADSMESVFRNEYQLRMFLAGLSSKRIDEVIKAVEEKQVGLSDKETAEYLEVFTRMRAEIGEIRTQARTKLENMKFVIDALIPDAEDDATPVSHQEPQAHGEVAASLPISLGEEIVTTPLTEPAKSIPQKTIAKEKAAKPKPRKKPAAKPAVKPAEKPVAAIPKKEDKKMSDSVDSLFPESSTKEASPAAPSNTESRSVSEAKPLQETEWKSVREYLLSQGFHEISETRYRNNDGDFDIEIVDGKVDYRRSAARIAGSWELNSEEKKWVAEVAVILASQKKKR